MLENVPEYERSDAAQVLRSRLQEMGYKWHEQVYNASEYGSLQARRRQGDSPTSDGVEFSPPAKQQSRPWVEAIADGVSRMPIETDPRSIRSVTTKGAEALRARGHDPATYNNWVLLDGAHYEHKPNIRLANEPAMTIKAKANEIVRIWNPATNEIRRADGRFMARLFDVPDDISARLADSPYGHLKTGFGDSIPFKMVQAAGWIAEDSGAVSGPKTQLGFDAATVSVHHDHGHGVRPRSVGGDVIPVACARPSAMPSRLRAR
jgi:site-specific DNA-cytosine methylase